ncbi:uncharacterized protein LOC105786747 [Gossypium raimondii]|uniref:uncharacterized protein LOC105786747 n=1 Tax=Gossypium raimondii TaxID=29730 RepID=UPI00227D4C9A|nr:uncharacterized protein LOC105786747 [Gossypium raimondii]
MTTPEYYRWWSKRINDNIPKLREDCVQSLEEYLQVVPSELEIIKQDFEKRSSEWGKKIEQLEEENMRLGLDVDVHKLEAEKLRKGKNKAEEDFDSVKTDYKKLRLSMRTADLKARVAELEKSLNLYRGRNSTIKLRASLNKIEELKGKIEELEDALYNSELRVELLERHNEQYQEQFHPAQNQIRDRDYIMGQVITQVREVADHPQTLAVQGDVLSLSYELESSRGRELAQLLRSVKTLSIRAKPYM